MQRKMIAFILSMAVAVSGVTVSVMAEDFSDSEVLIEQESEPENSEQELPDVENDTLEMEENGEAEADISVDEEMEEEEQDEAETEVFDSESEDLFSDTEELPDVASVGVIGGNIKWNYPGNIIPTEKSVADEGNILLGVRGSYITDVQAALKLINSYRKEACDKGYPDPRDPKRKLTSKDYVPIRWSSDLEYIARIRAAEASVVSGHTRPNGESCFSLESPNGIGSSSEVLAWNSGSDSMTTGIVQWYDEKNTWVNQGNGVTGHYTSMIDPDNLYVGIGAFNNPNADPWEMGTYPYTCAGEFSGFSGLDESKAPAIANCTQIIEVEKADAKPEIQFSVTGQAMRPGKTAQASLVYDVEGIPLVYVKGATGDDSVTWKSSNTKVARIDQNGKIASGALGSAVITATVGNTTVSSTLKVKKIIVDLWDTDIWVDDPVYTGSNIKPSITVKYDGEKLKAGRDYTVTYTKASQAGSYIRITVKGKGDYKGTVSGYVKISRKSINKFKVKGISATKAYTGKNITQKISVYNGNKKLKSTDYTIKYSGNKNPGKVTVKITGKGNYSGTITKTFNIVPAKMKKPVLKAGKKKITVSYKKTAGVTGYQIAYSVNKKNFQYVNVSAKNTKAVLQRLMSKKNYYVKVRAYKSISGKKYYGAYSDVSRVKVK